MKFQTIKLVKSRPLFDPEIGTVAVTEIMKDLKDAPAPSNEEITIATGAEEEVTLRLYNISNHVVGLVYLAVHLEVVTKADAELFATPWARGLKLRDARAKVEKLGNGWYRPDGMLLLVESKGRKGLNNVNKKCTFPGEDDD